MKKDLILSSKDEKFLENRNVGIQWCVAKIKLIMKRHIGVKNSIKADELFWELFGFNFNDRPHLATYLWNDYARKGMHRCRQEGLCFVVCKLDKAVYRYYVPTSKDEIVSYINQLDNSIKRMAEMKKNAAKYIDRKGWEKEWLTEKDELFLTETDEQRTSHPKKFLGVL